MGGRRRERRGRNMTDRKKGKWKNKGGGRQGGRTEWWNIIFHKVSVHHSNLLPPKALDLF